MKRLLLILLLIPLLGTAQQLRYTFSADPADTAKYFFYDAAGELAGYTLRSGDGLTIIYNAAGRITGYEQQVTDRTLLLDKNRNRIGYKQVSPADSTIMVIYDTGGVQVGYERKVAGWDRRELYSGKPATAAPAVSPGMVPAVPTP